MATIVLTIDTISEVAQYDFKPEYLTVTPKHVRLPWSEEDLTGISGLENISNPVKTVNISAKVNIQEIVLVASRQAKKKGRKSSLSNHPKFYQTDATLSPPKITENALEDEATVKTAIFFSRRCSKILQIISSVYPLINSGCRPQTIK